MSLRALHISLLMEADRHGSVHPVTVADRAACVQLQKHGYLTAAGDITRKGRAAARQGER